MEIKIDARRLELIRNRCGIVNGICLHNNGKSGGVGLWWQDVTVNITTYSTHHIEAVVWDKQNNPCWKALGIYGWPEAANKHYTRSLMREIRNSCALAPTINVWRL